MIERYQKGEDGWQERHRADKRTLHDLVRYFEYGKTTNFKAARVSEEQERYWADQLKNLLDEYTKLTLAKQSEALK